MTGRSVLDLLRHRVGFAIRNEYPTRVEFWQRAYEGVEGRAPLEWGRTGYDELESYGFVDVRAGGVKKGRSRWRDDVPERSRVLIVGSGTSVLGVRMRDAGWRDVTHVDFAPAVIPPPGDELEGLRWKLGDARDLGAVFDRQLELFEAVVDKGTVDSIYLSGSPNHERDIEAIVDGAAKVATQGGTFITFSLTHPDYLLPILHTMKTSPNWDWDNLQVRKLDAAYMYLLTRRPQRYRMPR